jgi:hypothetical protein
LNPTQKWHLICLSRTADFRCSFLQCTNNIYILPLKGHRAAFERGIIGIYSDAWNNGSPLNTSNSDRLWKGNSYTFDQGGEVHFLLITDDKVVSLPFENPIPTITINVQS